MKNLFFIVAGAMFLFVSCQSDDLPIYEASKSDNAKKVTKMMTFRTYEGEISIFPDATGCTYVDPDAGVPLRFLQTGGGTASHIGKYTFENTACLGEFGLEQFVGAITAANGDKILYDLPFDGIECETTFPPPCADGENTTFTYEIIGGTGRFEGAVGTITIKGPFVSSGLFSASGSAEITY